MILQSEAHNWFELEVRKSCNMLLVAPVLEQHRIPLNEQDAQAMSDDLDLRNRINVARSTIPAVTHVDYSARVQTVDDGRNPRFAKLMQSFHERTGCPVLVNTSFNVRRIHRLLA